MNGKLDCSVSDNSLNSSMSSKNLIEIVDALGRKVNPPPTNSSSTSMTMAQ